MTPSSSEPYCNSIAEITAERIGPHAEGLGRKSVAKRLGFLLEAFGLGGSETVASLGELVSASYTLADPTLPDEGRYLSRWRVRMNVDPDELRAAVTT